MEDVRQTDALVSLSPEVNKGHIALRNFLEEKMYSHYRVIRMAEKANRTIKDLFYAYLDEPKQLPPDFYNRIGEEPKEMVICDYIAGMTDRFAQEEYKKLFDPHTLV